MSTSFIYIILPLVVLIPEMLEQRNNSDEGLVVPEPDSVGNGGVVLGEQILELADLKEISDYLVAA